MSTSTLLLGSENPQISSAPAPTPPSQSCQPKLPSNLNIKSPLQSSPKSRFALMIPKSHHHQHPHPSPKTISPNAPLKYKGMCNFSFLHDGSKLTQDNGALGGGWGRVNQIKRVRCSSCCNSNLLLQFF